MWLTLVAILMAWCVVPLPLAVAIGRAFAAGERADEPLVAPAAPAGVRATA